MTARAAELAEILDGSPRFTDVPVVVRDSGLPDTSVGAGAQR